MGSHGPCAGGARLRTAPPLSSATPALRLQMLAARAQWEADRQGQRGGEEVPPHGGTGGKGRACSNYKEHKVRVVDGTAKKWKCTGCAAEFSKG
jgi:hypothetical protein